MEEPKKKGRPRGKGRRPLAKWNPKVWEPIYDIMVTLAAQGRKNTEIAEITGYTPVHVSNVLTSDRALIAKVEIIKQGRKDLAETFTGRVQQLQDLTISRTHDLLNDQAKFDKNPFHVIKAGLDVTRALLPKENDQLRPNSENAPSNQQAGEGNINIGQAIIFTGPQTKELNEGLNKLMEVKKLHSGNGNDTSK